MEATSPIVCRPKRCSLSFHLGSKGEKVDGVGSEEGRRIRGNPGGPLGPAHQGCEKGGEFALSQSHPWMEVLGCGVKQGADQTGIAAVHTLQSIQAHVGCAQLRPLHPVADTLERSEHTVEYPLIRGLVGFKDDGARVMGDGLLQGHPRRYTGGCWEGVDDQGPALGAVHDDGGPVRKVRLFSQLDLGPQMGDEHTGDPQGASLVS